MKDGFSETDSRRVEGSREKNFFIVILRYTAYNKNNKR